jgi:predicted ATPase/DNA-binding CsgD family transcriptional regulator
VTDEAGRNQQSVLVMDNCEHVLVGAGQLIGELLEAVPGLTILATSREAVGWVDEYVVVVPSLSQEQALILFRQRAKLTGYRIVEREDIAKATLICRHVHNHPLYIRLAAARLLRQPLAMIVQELSGEVTDKRMRWSHGPRVGEPRHQGIRDVIAWSYELCLDQERLLLDRMSVFAAGYDTNLEDDTSSIVDVGVDVEAIQVVCADDPRQRDQANGRGAFVRLAAKDVEGVLERLVDQSLVTAHITPATVRYSLLESVRVFAAQRLQERSTGEVDEPARLARRHRRYYRDKIVAAQLNWISPAQQELLDWVRAAWDNLVRAIETSLTSGEPTLGLEISASLTGMPTVKGSPREMRQWTERALQATRALTPQPTDLQIKAMALIGWNALVQGKDEYAERMLEESAAASIRDPEIRHDWRQTPEIDIGLPAPVEFTWGLELMMVHRDPRAIAVFARAREKFRVLGDHGSEARTAEKEAWAASNIGSAQQAMRITRRNLDYATASGAGWLKAWAEMERAIALTKHGSPTEALTLERSALAYQLAAHDQWGGAWTVHIRIWSLAQILRDMITAGRTDRAELRALATEIAQLAGGAATLRAGLGIDLGDGPFADDTNKAINVARGVLGREVFATAQRQGSLLRPELHEVQRLALGTLSPDRLPIDHPARQNLPSRWQELSTAEQQVATLAAAGWTNSAIAARRGNSCKTIDAQMAAIFRKLVITSRDDIIKLVPKDQIAQVRSEAAKQPRRTSEKRSRPRLR